jgi:TonB family protein
LPLHAALLVAGSILSASCASVRAVHEARPTALGARPPEAPPASERAFKPSEVDEPPGCRPEAGLDLCAYYPEEARKRQLEGVVLTVIQIEENGAISKSAVVKDPGGGLGPAALEILKHYSCEPAKKAGKPVPSLAPFKLIFTLP